MQKQAIWTKLKRFLLYILILFVIPTCIILMSIPFAKYIVPNDLLPVENQNSITIDNINIITMEPSVANDILKNRQIVIQQGLITAINPSGTPVLKGSRLIDAKQGYVVPGLFDMHVHLYERKYLVLNLAYGVTSVRAMNGNVESLRWKTELSDDQWLASNLYLSSPILDGTNAHLMNQSVASPEESRMQVRKAVADGYDFIKAYGYLEPTSFKAIVDEANRMGIKVAKHGPHPIKGSDWSGLEGLQSLEHVEDIFQGPLNYQFNYAELDKVVKKIEELNLPVVPTLETFDHLTQISKSKQVFIDGLDLEYLNPFYFDLLQHYSVDRWLNTNEQQIEYLAKEIDFLLEVTGKLHKAGVKLLVGSDAGTNHTIPGIATHNEMRLMKQAGLSDYEVIKAATINAAETLGVEDEYGSIKIGKIADLVITRNNPLKDINELSRLNAVVKKGQWLDQKKLTVLKESAKNNQSFYWSGIKLLETLIDKNIL